MGSDDKICIAGVQTIFGQALYRQLGRQGYNCILEDEELEPDLTDAAAVDSYFSAHKPEIVFLVAGKSGGIKENEQRPAELMLDNLLVQNNVINSAFHHGVRKLLYLASSCSYPKNCAQPMRVEDILTGSLEPTNEAYAVAKIAGIKLCQAYRQQHGSDFIVGIPGNAFGLNDDFDPESGHVIPALIRRMHEAKENAAPSIDIWGTGTPKREFVFADDLADACIFVMRHYSDLLPINLGSGEDLSISELAGHIKEVVGFSGQIVYDTKRPDGMPFKALDSQPLLDMGWRPQTSFKDALECTYQWFLKTLVAA